MKYKFSLILFLLSFLSFAVIGQAGGDQCACNQAECDASFNNCTLVGGDFGFSIYPTQQSCFDTETTCGGVPLNTNSWTLVLVGFSIIAAGVFFTKRYSDE